MQNDYEKLLEQIRQDAESHVKKSRYEHSVRVAETAEKMCALYGADCKKGYLAGIAHDICKDYPLEELYELASKDGREITELEKRKSELLHGRAAAVRLSEVYGIDDKEILEAVSCHTFGSVSLGKLGKIIFAADKIEPGRPQSTEEYRKNLFSKDLDSLVLQVLEENKAYLEKNGKEMARESLDFLASLKNKTGGGK
ncbi:MAG: bis(5'-nucleosyl)-tetraphosphatase (symmetrical) YqeK [Treponema sp.]|nr:bis(5'-nucleosyl)-tetraphosphatase (symmetrical) YqeK [Treponema sp.]